MELKDYVEQTLEEWRERLYRTIDDLTPDELVWQPNAEANPIGFIVWHVARIEDGWAHRFGTDTEEVWTRDGWHIKLGLPESDHGAGYTPEQVASFHTPSLGDLKAYLDDVRKDMLEYIRGLEPPDFDVVPGRYPFAGSPSSAGSYFTSFSVGRMFRQLNGELYQHLGHIGYLRGLIRGHNQ
ncbi:MAG: DinB family protein [Chloroflexi bacterium]|nr:DinB family protein [Chloroflexota bacterium]